jgi:uncharacterized protein with beta-barrel porin domain
VVLFVNGGSTVTLRGRSVPTDMAYRFFVPNGTLVIDHSDALIDNTTSTMTRKSLFILGPAAEILDFGYSLPSGFLIASNNVLDCAVLLGDSDYPAGGLTVAANVTNYVSDGGAGFTNFGTMTLGGQNTSGTNTYANRIVLGWTPDRGKSVTLVATAGGEIDFTGDIVRNGTDTWAGVTVGSTTRGGIVKLAGTNTYLGDTKVVSGALLVEGSLAGGVVVQSGGTLGGSGIITGPVIVLSRGRLSPGGGLGTLHLNSLVLAPGSEVYMEINASNGTSDIVSGLSSIDYAGSLLVTNVAGKAAVGQSFQLFSALNPSGRFDSITTLGSADGLLWRFNPAEGVLSATASGRANLICNVSVTHLTVSWPSDHLGWSLATQTNNLAYGLSLDPADWATIPGTESTTSMTIPLDRGHTAGFYRLVYP